MRHTSSGETLTLRFACLPSLVLADRESLICYTCSPSSLPSMLHAPGEEVLEGADVEDGADLDYFDVEDLGRLRRSLQKAIGDTQRERELYQEIVQQYIEAGHRPVWCKAHGASHKPSRCLTIATWKQ